MCECEKWHSSGCVLTRQNGAEGYVELLCWAKEGFLRNPSFNLLLTHTPSPWVSALQAGAAGGLKPSSRKITALVFPLLLHGDSLLSK